MSEERPPSPGLPLPLTPSAFLEAVAARLDRLHGADAYPVLLRGIPVRTGSTSRAYGGSGLLALIPPLLLGLSAATAYQGGPRYSFWPDWLVQVFRDTFWPDWLV